MAEQGGGDPMSRIDDIYDKQAALQKAFKKGVFSAIYECLCCVFIMKSDCLALRSDER
jgi:hypothetical protein